MHCIVKYSLKAWWIESLSQSERERKREWVKEKKERGESRGRRNESREKRENYDTGTEMNVSHSWRTFACPFFLPIFPAKESLSSLSLSLSLFDWIWDSEVEELVWYKDSSRKRRREKGSKREGEENNPNDLIRECKIVRMARENNGILSIKKGGNGRVRITEFETRGIKEGNRGKRIKEGSRGKRIKEGSRGKVREEVEWSWNDRKDEFLSVWCRTVHKLTSNRREPISSKS